MSILARIVVPKVASRSVLMTIIEVANNTLIGIITAEIALWLSIAAAIGVEGAYLKSH